MAGWIVNAALDPNCSDSHDLSRYAQKRLEQANDGPNDSEWSY
jgi:hypothetical protein